MNISAKQARLLAEDLEMKRTYDAKWETQCDSCDNTIYQGDSFIFLGDKNKVCMECTNFMQEALGGDQ